MNLNAKQVIAIILVILGVITASTAQLTDLFGPSATKAIVSIASMVNSILAGALGVISSQTGLVKDVQAMPGVEKITVNAQANSTLASMAVDPSNEKIEPKPGSEGAVQAAANN